MKILSAQRVRFALRAAGLHWVASVLVAAMAAGLVFGVWYPHPFDKLAGGRELFILLVSVDVICGPLLTAVLASPSKPRTELTRDLALVVCIQLAALLYGLHSVWVARPLYLVLELDRYKVVAAPDLTDPSELAQLGPLAPHWLRGPQLVSLRPPKDADERNTVLLESAQGGRDYAERPEFYLPYTAPTTLRALDRAKPLNRFTQKYPDQATTAATIARAASLSPEALYTLPVMGRQDWVAVLDAQGQVRGYLKGDGF